MAGRIQSRKRTKSAEEIEAIAIVSQSLLALERAAARTDAQIVYLAQAVDAIALGAFDTARALAAQALLPHDSELTVAPAHIVVQGLALCHISRKFMRLAAGNGSDRARRLGNPSRKDAH